MTDWNGLDRDAGTARGDLPDDPVPAHADRPAEAPLPDDVDPRAERTRLDALHALAILDTARDPVFDRIAELARRTLGTMAAAVSFVDRHRQWFKAIDGLDVCESPRSHAFCHFTVKGHELFVVENAPADPRFADNPFVTGPVGLRFYAGAPLRSPDRQLVGALCVLDDAPRQLSTAQRIVLRLLADLVEDAIRMHLARERMRVLAEEKSRQVAFLELKNRQLAQAEAVAEVGVFSFDAASETACFSDLVYHLMDRPVDAPLAFADLLARFPVEDARAIRQLLLGGEEASFRTERPVAAADGTERWLRLSVERLGAPGRDLRLVGMLQNVTEERRHREEIAFLTRHDPLTGLLNRAGYEEALAAARAGLAAGGGKAGLCLVDIDGFRAINERYGVRHGDLLLKAVADRLQRAVREGDRVVRLGDDEFAVVLAGLRCGRDLSRIRRRLLSALDFRMDLGGEPVRVTSAVGIALAPDDVSAELDLHQAAEAALSEARRAGPGRWQRFEPSLKASRDRSRLFLEEIRQGLRACQFVPFLQPKVRLSDGAIVGFEALIRWQHPERGLLGPHFFMAALDDEEVGGELSDVTFASTFEIAGSFLGRGIAVEHFSINLNGAQLERRDIVEEAVALARIHGVPPATIMFEVVENVLIRDRPEVLENLRRLAEAGFGISLDDFGTGYASLTNIREPFIREVKIDRSFVMRCPTSEHDLQIVSAIVNMARNMGLSVVAEGVETERHVKTLVSLGCEVGQGYLFSPPVSVGEAIRYCLRKKKLAGLLGS